MGKQYEQMLKLIGLYFCSFCVTLYMLFNGAMETLYVAAADLKIGLFWSNWIQKCNFCKSVDRGVCLGGFGWDWAKNPGKLNQPACDRLIDFLAWFAAAGVYVQA